MWFSRRLAPAVFIGVAACSEAALLGGGPSHELPADSDASANDETTRLSELALSDGDLDPPFAPSVLTYTTTTTRGPFTVRPTAQNPHASIKVNGVAVASGQMSAAIALVSGSSVPVDIVVTAPNGRSATYTVRTSLESELQGQEAYVKPSNTGNGWGFGKGVAISADGNTLAIGAVGEASRSGAVYVFVHAAGAWSQQAYLKASNSRPNLEFGDQLALSGDGNTLVVGAPKESSNASGINGDQNDTSYVDSGAAYVFTRSATTWSQQAYIKPSNNTNHKLGFGSSIGLSTDGNILAVGAPVEPGGATGIDGAPDVTTDTAGAAYVFGRTNGVWTQRTYVKASNTRAFARFGGAVALSGAGDVLVVGSSGESSSAHVIDGDQSEGPGGNQGAAYVFKRQGSSWAQTTYLKVSGSRPDLFFGDGVSISRDGTTIAVASRYEPSKAKGIDGDELDQSLPSAGAVWVFVPAGTSWSQQAYVKASNTSASYFGTSMALSDDGNVLAVGAIYEGSAATGLDGSQADASNYSGAAYVFHRWGKTWSQKTYVKPSNTRNVAGLSMGFGAALAYGGGVLVVGASGETSGATGINGDQEDTSTSGAGAAYIFR